MAIKISGTTVIDDNRNLTNIVDLNGTPVSDYLTSETTTTLSFAANTLTYTDETGTANTIDLSAYLDDTNLARLTSGTLNGSTGIATFTRDDATTFTIDFSDLLNSAEVNDLTSSVTWANVPDANITESSVTQHQAALSITESQISDLQSYLTSVSLNDLTDVDVASVSDGQVLKYDSNTAKWIAAADSESAGGDFSSLSVTTNTAGTAA